VTVLSLNGHELTWTHPLRDPAGTDMPCDVNGRMLDKYPDFLGDGAAFGTWSPDQELMGPQHQQPFEAGCMDENFNLAGWGDRLGRYNESSFQVLVDSNFPNGAIQFAIGTGFSNGQNFMSNAPGPAAAFSTLYTK
jgi:hypothetical protein